MLRAQGEFDEKLEQKFNEVVKRVQEQKDAASEAHLTTLKIAYGDLDGDMEGLNDWCEKKKSVKSEVNKLNKYFGK